MIVDLKILEKHQEVCKSCGLCCNGSLFKTASIEKSSHHLLKVKQNESGDYYFNLPCNAHIDGCCVIYSKRPEACAVFQCKLLKKVNAKKITDEQALLLVSLTKNQICELEYFMLKKLPELTGNSYHDRYENFTNYYRNKLGDKGFEKDFGILQSKYNTLDTYLKEHFYEGPR